jgi:hypothetical protein
MHGAKRKELTLITIDIFQLDKMSKEKNYLKRDWTVMPFIRLTLLGCCNDS